jgi:hypothetical protein
MRYTKLMGLLLASSLVFPVISTAAQDNGEVKPIELPSIFPAEYDGDIAIAGSSTVEPVTVAMAARFNDDGFGGNITVDETARPRVSSASASKARPICPTPAVRSRMPNSKTAPRWGVRCWNSALAPTRSPSL